jgi:hypothetical protein
MLSHEGPACLTPSECTGAVYQDEVVVVLTLLLLPYDPARPAQLDRVYDRGCVVQATDCHVSVYACSLRTERRSECRTAAAAAAPAAEIVAMQHLGPHEAAQVCTSYSQTLPSLRLHPDLTRQAGRA